jgi:hypothetical protein
LRIEIKKTGQMKSKILFISVLLFGLITAKAQSKFTRGAEIGLYPTFEYYNLNNLNKAVKTDGGGGFYNFYATRGAYIQDAFHKVVFSFGFSDGVTANSTKNSVSTITAQNDYIGLGYKLIEHKSFALYPELGFGIGYLRLERHTALSGMRLFSSTDNAPGFSITSPMDNVDLGAEVRWYSPSSFAPEHLKVGVALKGGCQYLVSKPDWKGPDNQTVTGVPATPNYMPYLQLRLFFMFGNFKE